MWIYNFNWGCVDNKGDTAQLVRLKKLRLAFLSKNNLHGTARGNIQKKGQMRHRTIKLTWVVWATGDTWTCGKKMV